jgi:hypothetical protein
MEHRRAPAIAAKRGVCHAHSATPVRFLCAAGGIAQGGATMSTVDVTAGMSVPVSAAMHLVDEILPVRRLLAQRAAVDSASHAETG